MKAIILAAGIGSRLYAETEGLAKSLVKIAGKTMIEHQLDLLNFCGIFDIVVVIGYQAEEVKRCVGYRARFIYNPNFRATESGYSLWLAREEVREGWLHFNCDVLFHPDILRRLIASEYPDALVVDTEVIPYDDQQKVRLSNGRIRHMDKRLPLEESSGEAIGMGKFSRQGGQVIFKAIEDLIAHGVLNRQYFPIVSDVGKYYDIHAVYTDGLPWVEVDYPEDLEKAGRVIGAISKLIL